MVFSNSDSSQSIFVVLTSPGGSGKSVLVSAMREHVALLRSEPDVDCVNQCIAY
jgi:predicted ATPase